MSKSSNKKKGQLVEQIVAMLHTSPGVKVERNKRIPPKSGMKRYREIDVLITGTVAGYPVRFAIECKNEKKPIGSPKIDAFIGKLTDIDIPTKNGIYVSVSGYTRGALDRCNSTGIRPLVLDGLTPDRLSQVLKSASQSVVYLLMKCLRIDIIDKTLSNNLTQLSLFYNENGELCGSVPDLILSRWLQDPSLFIGKHRLDIEVPLGWCRYIGGEEVPVESLIVDVQVVGLMASFSGQFSEDVLYSVPDKTIKKYRLSAQFDIPKTDYPITVFESESELEKYKHSQNESLRFEQIIKLPRIMMNAIYWPPSQKAASKIFDAVSSGRDIRDINFADIEGSDLQEIWNTNWYRFPKIKRNS